MKTGSAYLPLHFGTAPRWLFEQMKRLAREISIILITEYGPQEFLARVSDPLWFQAFGCVLGFDWHSSGLTTTACATLKEGLKPIEKDLGIFICGGKGKISRKTPMEIKDKARQVYIDALSPKLIRASKIAAKVDNNALQDGYQLYHHTFFFTARGDWAVIQQGMNPESQYARRYHWLSNKVKDFVNEPHAGIASEIFSPDNQVLDLTAEKSRENRELSAQIAGDKPEKNLKILKKLKEIKLPPRHRILLSDINPDRLSTIFISTFEKQPKNFLELLGLSRVGGKTLRALALISELVYGKPASAKDPARYSFAHGGKDSVPYPIDQKTYTNSIIFLKEVINRAKLGYLDKLHAFRRLASVV